MNEKDVIREAMKSCGWTQTVLAEKAGYSAQSSLSSRLNGKSMRVDTFVKLLSAMGYEVVVQSTSPRENKNKWTLSLDTDRIEKSPVDVRHSTANTDLDELLGTDGQPSEPPVANSGRIRLT